MLSFWEKNTLTTYDYIIVGAGIVGLSTAASIKEQDNNATILVVERSLFPTGASTKNAGFACFGSVSELLDDLTKMPENAVQDLVKERWTGLQLLRKRLGDQDIGYLNHGGYELIFSKEVEYISHIDKINELLQPIFQKQVFEQKDALIDSFQFNKEKVKHLIYNKFEAQIDTGAMMDSLLTYVQKKGVRVLTGCEVTQFEDSNNGVQITIKRPFFQQEMVDFKAKKLLICTNAFTENLLPNIDLKPGRGQVIVTKPIENLPFKGVFHYDEGYFYFRNYGNRIIFGGGRNIDFEGEQTTEFKNTPIIMKALKTHLSTIISPHQKFEIDHQWAGIMAFGNTKQPIYKEVSPNIVLGVRLGGMGIAIGSKLGEKLALWALN